MNSEYTHHKIGFFRTLFFLVLLLVVWEGAKRFFRVEESLGEKGSPTQPARSANTPTPVDAPEFNAAERNNIDVFRRASPSVVYVSNKTLRRRDFFGFSVEEVPQGAGSGFVWNKEGHIISNFHVIYQASAISVTLQDGKTYDAKVVGVDPDHDIAVLKIEADAKDELVPITVGRSDKLLVGQKALAIGNPFGLDTSLSIGVVSALGRSIESMTGRRIYGCIQTDAAINPGNSGGPLLDSRGQLIGINTAILSPSGSAAGVGFAVPANTVKRIVPQLIKHGRTQRAGLGVLIVPDHIAEQSKVEGVAIRQVFRGGAAANAKLIGLQQTRGGSIVFGDIIVEADGQEIRKQDDLLELLDRKKVGDTVKLKYTRNGDVRETDVELQSLEK